MEQDRSTEPVNCALAVVHATLSVRPEEIWRGKETNALLPPTRTLTLSPPAHGLAVQPAGLTERAP